MARSVLFTGYAPVHFLCARPLCERLAGLPGVEVFVSGGLRTKTADGYTYDGPGMYGPLGVTKDRILSVSSLANHTAAVVGDGFSIGEIG